MRKESISIVGLGKLGLPLSAVFAQSGYKTYGIDINEDVIESVNRGISPIIEEGLDLLVEEFEGNH